MSDMDAHEHLSRNQAPDGKGLLQTILSLLTDLNRGKHSGSVWVNLKVERINCVWTHIRKLGRGPPVPEPHCCKADSSRLKQGLSLLELSECLEKQCNAAMGRASAKSLEKDDSQEPKPLEKGRGSKRLKKEDRDVSKDSPVTPWCLPAAVQLSRKRLVPPQIHLPWKRLRLLPPANHLSWKRWAGPGQAAGCSRNTLAGKKKPAAGGLEKPKPTVLEKTESGVKITKNPERSYLTGSTDGGKPHLIVEVSNKRCPKYLEVIRQIKESLEKHSITKAEAKALREKLCKDYECWASPKQMANSRKRIVSICTARFLETNPANGQHAFCKGAWSCPGSWQRTWQQASLEHLRFLEE